MQGRGLREGAAQASHSACRQPCEYGFPLPHCVLATSSLNPNNSPAVQLRRTPVCCCEEASDLQEHDRFVTATALEAWAVAGDYMADARGVQLGLRCASDALVTDILPDML